MWREIYSLNQKKAVGHDGIPINFIKLANESIAALLALIFNKCVTTGVYPTCLKQAKVPQYIKVELNISVRITGQYQLYPRFQKFSKD